MLKGNPPLGHLRFSSQILPFVPLHNLQPLARVGPAGAVLRAHRDNCEDRPTTLSKRQAKVARSSEIGDTTLAMTSTRPLVAFPTRPGRTFSWALPYFFAATPVRPPYRLLAETLTVGQPDKNRDRRRELNASIRQPFETAQTTPPSIVRYSLCSSDSSSATVTAFLEDLRDRARPWPP